MAKVDESISPGDNGEASWANQVAENANRAGGFRDDLNGAETITGGDWPQPIFINSSGQVERCDADDVNKLNFHGFCIGNTMLDNPASIQNNGIVRGFLGLTVGAKYYVQDDKSIGTALGFYKIFVGVAISATELLIMKYDPEITGCEASDDLQISADTEQTQLFNITTYTKKKEIDVPFTGTIRVKFDIHDQGLSNTLYARVYKNGAAVGTERTNHTTSYVTFSEDFNVNAGDLIQLYLKAANSEQNWMSWRNFRIYYSYVIPSSRVGGIVNLDT